MFQIKTSLTGSLKSDQELPSEDQQTLYELVTAMTTKTRVPVTMELCGRVALLVRCL